MGGTYSFTTATKFNAYFNLTTAQSPFSNTTTMLQAISAGGGGCTALGRHAVAALLGKAAFPTTYAYNPTGSFEDLYNAIRNAFVSGDCSSLLASLSWANSQETNCSALKRLPGLYVNNGGAIELGNPVVTAAPNPFSDRVRFTITTPAEGHVQLEVVNVLGQRVGIAYDGYMQANATQVVDYKVPSSAAQNLIYVLRSGGKQITGKLLRVKD